MNLNEIKKALYRQKTTAYRNFTGKHEYQYHCSVRIDDVPTKLTFTVPVSDMGETDFGDSIPAQLLIRYLDTK